VIHIDTRNVCVEAVAHCMDMSWEAALLKVSMSYMFTGRWCGDDFVIVANRM